MLPIQLEGLAATVPSYPSGRESLPGDVNDNVTAAKSACVTQAAVLLMLLLLPLPYNPIHAIIVATTAPAAENNRSTTASMPRRRCSLGDVADVAGTDDMIWGKRVRRARNVTEIVRK